MMWLGEINNGKTSCEPTDVGLDLHSTSTLCGWAPSVIHLVDKQALAQFPKVQCLLLFLYLQPSHCLPYAQKCICILQMGNVNHRFRTHLLLRYTTIHKLDATVVTVVLLFLWLLFFVFFKSSHWGLGRWTDWVQHPKEARQENPIKHRHKYGRPRGKVFFQLGIKIVFVSMHDLHFYTKYTKVNFFFPNCF